MNQEGCSRKSQKIKNFVSAGSLASSRNKQILGHKIKQNSVYIPNVQVAKYVSKCSKCCQIPPLPHHKQHMNKCNKSHNFPPLLHRKQFLNKCSIIDKILPILKKMTNLKNQALPLTKEKEVVHKCKWYMDGLCWYIGKEWDICPLNVFNWKKLKTHDDMWNYIQEKYDIPDDGKEWAITAIKAARRGYKSRFKQRHFYAYGSDEIRMANRSPTVSEFAFKDILKYWNSKEAKDMSNTNKKNQKKLRYPHTVGKTGFAIIREEKKKETPGALSSKDFFVATRRRKPDRVYKESYADTSNKIAEIERMGTLETEDGTQTSVDTFAAVMGPEHPGRVRLYGRGVTKTLLK